MLEVANTSKEPIFNFTDDQLKAYNDLISFIKEPFNKNDAKRALTGPAGTGKTFLVKALIKNCGLSYSTIGLSAPTHKAGRVLNESINIRNLNINTLQSDLGLKINYNVDNFDINNPPFDPYGRVKIGDYKLYIVDEASMINRDLCLFLEKTCIKNETKLLYIGDASQLPPPKEYYSPAFKGIKMNTLTQIVRQGDDNPVSDLLVILRNDIKNKTFKFLEYITKNRERYNNDHTKGFEVCNEEDFKNKVIEEFTNEQLTSNIDLVKVIAYTNVQVSAWNKFIRSIIIKDNNKSIITKNDLLTSYITIVDAFNQPIIKNSEEYILKDVVNYVHPKYDLKGFMIRLIAIHGGEVTTPLFVIDHTDQFTLTKYVQISNHLINEAKHASSGIKGGKWQEYYEFKEKCLTLVNIKTTSGDVFNRSLDYGFALTAHKSQGSTFDTTLVDVNNIVFDKNGTLYNNAEELNRRLYVACSRTKNKLYLKYG